MRTLPLALVLLVAGAGSLTAAPAISVDDLELLPLSPTRRPLFELRHAELLGKVRNLDRRAKRAEKAERKRLRRQRDQGLAELVRLLAAEEGVAEERLAVLELAPQGPRRLQRYAQALILRVTDPSPRQAALLGRALDGARAAQWALLAQRAALTPPKGGDEDPARGELRRGLDRHLRAIDERLWRLADLVLEPEQLRSLRRHLPTRLRVLRDPMQHLLRVPGLRPAQSARLQALQAEQQAESAADRAELRRLGQELKAPQLDPQTRRELGTRHRAARQRLAELNERVATGMLAVLSAEQQAALEAVAPSVRPRDRSRGLDRLLRGVRLNTQQKQTVQRLNEELAAAKRAQQADQAELGQMGQDFGPDSPQQQTMMMGRLELEGARTQTLRDAARVLFFEVLTEEQVVGWVVAHPRS